MEEREYKSTYNELVSVRCVFEKALTSHQAKCSLSRHFCLADREGYSCENAELSGKCSKFLEKLREKSIFVLKLHEVNGPLPHNMEIRVQAGGMMGLAKLVCVNAVGQSKQPVVDDISRILSDMQKKYGLLANWPYSEIIQSVVQFQGRRRRQR
jgi:hypothetical protein